MHPGRLTPSSNQASFFDQMMMWAAIAMIVVLCVVIVVSEPSLLALVSKPDILKGDVCKQNQDDRMALVPVSVVSKQLASSGEQETRNSLVRLFGKPFVSIRPPFLVNPETGRRLELDCYNEELKLGVEFSGLQHYVYPNPFHRTQAEFDAQLRRDRYKSEQCKQQGIKLITVPFTIKRPNIEAFLHEQLVLAGFTVNILKIIQ